LAYCVCAGSLRAMHQPVRASYAYDLVGQENLVSAMGLLNLGSRCGQLAGALVAGYVTENLSAAAAVWCLAGGHLTAFLVFRSLREAGVAAVKEHVPIRQNIREYIQELKVNRLLLMLLIVTAAAEVFGFSFATAFPEIVTGRLELGAEGLGLLQASRASAGVVAGIAFATFGARNRAGIIYLLTIAAFGAGLVCLAQASTLVTVLAAMFLASICAATCDILSQSMLQLSVSNELRGRAMGIWVLALGFGPIGHLELGSVAEAVGLTTGLLINGCALIAIACLAAVFAPRLRRL
ncbi:MAG: MFS transporter, partial [Pseudomonadota bacterium]|nr:MFS transporter [Pseudomonadota bacterium]